MGYRPRGCRESDTVGRLTHSLFKSNHNMLLIFPPVLNDASWLQETFHLNITSVSLLDPFLAFIIIYVISSQNQYHHLNLSDIVKVI